MDQSIPHCHLCEPLPFGRRRANNTECSIGAIFIPKHRRFNITKWLPYWFFQKLFGFVICTHHLSFPLSALSRRAAVDCGRLYRRAARVYSGVYCTNSSPLKIWTYAAHSPDTESALWNFTPLYENARPIFTLENSRMMCDPLPAFAARLWYWLN